MYVEGEQLLKVLDGFYKEAAEHQGGITAAEAGLVQAVEMGLEVAMRLASFLDGYITSSALDSSSNGAEAEGRGSGRLGARSEPCKVLLVENLLLAVSYVAKAQHKALMGQVPATKAAAARQAGVQGLDLAAMSQWVWLWVVVFVLKQGWHVQLCQSKDSVRLFLDTVGSRCAWLAGEAGQGEEEERRRQQQEGDGGQREDVWELGDKQGEGEQEQQRQRRQREGDGGQTREEEQQWRRQQQREGVGAQMRDIWELADEQEEWGQQQQQQMRRGQQGREQRDEPIQRETQQQESQQQQRRRQRDRELLPPVNPEAVGGAGAGGFSLLDQKEQELNVWLKQQLQEGQQQRARQRQTRVRHEQQQQQEEDGQQMEGGASPDKQSLFGRPSSAAAYGGGRAAAATASPHKRSLSRSSPPAAPSAAAYSGGGAAAAAAAGGGGGGSTPSSCSKGVRPLPTLDLTASQPGWVVATGAGGSTGRGAAGKRRRASALAGVGAATPVAAALTSGPAAAVGCDDGDEVIILE